MTLTFFLAGCAHYANYDYYQPSDESPANFRSLNHFYFETMPGFVSIGPLGMPVIPVGLPSQHETLVLAVNVEHHRNIPFSIKSMPCILLVNGEKICAKKYGVSGFIESQVLKWPNDRKAIDYGPEGVNSSVLRITNEQIFERVGFVFTPEWDWLVLTVHYEFQCGHSCPSTFTLDSSDLLEVNGARKFNVKVKYSRKTKSEYDAVGNPVN